MPHPTLTRLLRSCAGIDGIIPLGESLPAFDVHAPLMSLPAILKTTFDTIPARIPYLYAEPARGTSDELSGTSRSEGSGTRGEEIQRFLHSLAPRPHPSPLISR